MGNKIKAKMRKLAVSTSCLFDAALFGESAEDITLRFPKPLKIKSYDQSFKSDIRTVAGDFRRSLNSDVAQK